MKLAKYFSVLLLTFFLAGCGLSDGTVDTAKKLESTISKAKIKVSKSKESFLKDPKTSKLQNYVEKENLLKSFSIASTLVDKAEVYYKKNLVPMLKKDDSDDENMVIAHINNINGILRNVIFEISKPSKRITILSDILKNSKSYLKKSTELTSKANGLNDGFVILANSMIEKYPSKKTDIEKRKASVLSVKSLIDNSFVSLKKEIDKKSMDLTLFSKEYDSILNNYKKLEALVKKETTIINQLDKSYTKILSDMKEVYVVKVGRVSWNDYYDLPRETTYIYPDKIVNKATFDYFDSIGEQKLGTLGGGLFSSSSRNEIRSNLNSNYVKALGVNARQNFPRGDDSAEFWIENLFVKYYHKYTYIRNGKKNESNWIEVSAQEFEKQYNNLGMEIVSKPYGFYESEKITSAAPAGMSYVGNKHYGQWKQDSSGHSFWYYYGMYSFMNNMFGNNNHGYYRNDYNSYYDNRRNHKSYYGTGSRTYGTYGASTYRTGSRYSKTNFARTNSRTVSSVKSGKRSSFKTRSSSVRSSAGKSRGRGPGGGGK